ncbi:hypothetical protein Cpir12675_002498 [Ceratocystis pirilliformis]|uniref:CCHC-type domain-containing protein n=1 Tax=Ceratocystis pirilliformis TaxID=259994 RepID=A0ABR3ZAM6_9PEZI
MNFQVMSPNELREIAQQLHTALRQSHNQQHALLNALTQLRAERQAQPAATASTAAGHAGQPTTRDSTRGHAARNFTNVDAPLGQAAGHQPLLRKLDWLQTVGHDDAVQGGDRRKSHRDGASPAGIRITVLRRAVKPRLAGAPLLGTRPASYHEFVLTTFGLASDLEAFDTDRYRRSETWNGNRDTRTSANTDVMDWQATDAVQLKPLTIDERGSLRKKGACFRCRKTGHMRSERPTAKQQRVIMKAAEISHPGPAIPELTVAEN